MFKRVGEQVKINVTAYPRTLDGLSDAVLGEDKQYSVRVGGLGDKALFTSNPLIIEAVVP